jgi:hypothetical protein
VTLLPITDEGGSTHPLMVITVVLLCACGLTSTAVAQTEGEPAFTATVDAGAPSTHFSTSINSMLGLTFQNISKSDDETLTVQWLASVNARMTWDNTTSGLSSSLFAQYGQLHTVEAVPLKTQDNLIMSVTPSTTLIKAASIRAFLEVTGETQMAPGMVDTVPSDFLDPLFLYETVFLGQYIQSNADDGSGEFKLIYGLGYSMQQTVTNRFILASNRNYVIGPDNPLSAVQSQVTVESGLSAVVDMSARAQLAENLNLNVSIKAVALGKADSYKNWETWRCSGLALANISYGIITIDYTMRLLYDATYSIRRQLEQSLVLGLRFSF